MGKGGSLAAAALLLFLGGLGAAYGSGHGGASDCTTVRWQPTQETQGGATYCEGGGQVGGLQLPGLGNVPLVPQHPEQPPQPWYEPFYGPNGFMVVNCPTTGLGVMVLKNEHNASFVCIEFDIVAPGGMALPQPTTGAAATWCDPEDIGLVAMVGPVWAGGCLVYQLVTPTRFDNPNPVVHADDCEVRGRGGVDPAILLFDGGFAFCAVIVFHTVEPDEPGEPPPIGYSVEPCSRSSIDPSVTIGDGGLFICVTFQIDVW